MIVLTYHNYDDTRPVATFTDEAALDAWVQSIEVTIEPDGKGGYYMVSPQFGKVAYAESDTELPRLLEYKEDFLSDPLYRVNLSADDDLPHDLPPGAAVALDDYAIYITHSFYRPRKPGRGVFTTSSASHITPPVFLDITKGPEE